MGPSGGELQGFGEVVSNQFPVLQESVGKNTTIREAAVSQSNGNFNEQRRNKRRRKRQRLWEGSGQDEGIQCQDREAGEE